MNAAAPPVDDPLARPAAAYTRRLAIVVPYRNRAAHLAQFVPHMLTYFQRDKLDCRIPYTIHIVEQAGGEPFNRGRLRNIGFLLAREHADYVCFHDVDYLPIWADYAYVDRPTRLAWHGLVLQENYRRFFGAVVAFNRTDFERVDGYSNEYWGWGFEDTDLRGRCERVGLAIAHRDGTYQSLPHEHAGWTPEGTRTAEAERNAAVYAEKQAAVAAGTAAPDGLSTTRFELLDTRYRVENQRVLMGVRHHVVRFG